MSDSYLTETDTDTMEKPGLSTADIAAGRTEPMAAEPAAPATSQQPETPFFPESEAGQLHQQWADVQTSFVDEPRRAVEQADELVAGAMKKIAETFADERASLERQWDSGADVSTEDLRIALQRYRTFFGRLLSI